MLFRSFDPARLVFIDETSTSTNMVRLRGRCRRGERLIGRVPQGRWKTITFVAGLRHAYRTRDEAKADVFDYIERFYNVRRRHSTIGYVSPMEFERQAGLA